MFRREAVALAHQDLTNPPRNGGRPSHPRPSLQAISLGLAREVAWRTSYPGKVYGIAKLDAALSPSRGRWFQHPGLNELADEDRERDLQHKPNDNQRGSHVYQRCP